MNWLTSLTQVGIALVLLCAGANPALALQELTEEELGRITAGAGSAQVVDGLVAFQSGMETSDGRYIEASGSVARSVAVPSEGPSSVLVLSDNAQGHLNSFITVNAVNSTVQLLINLNISINSTVGSVGQANAGYGPLP